VTFDDCLTYVLRDEGGYSDNPHDPGGATNLGVTRKAWEEWVGHPVSKDVIRSLTKAQVKPFYFAKYWMPVQGNSLPSGLNYAVFDCAVNSGVARASRLLQQVCGVTVDGHIGPLTVAAARKTPDVTNLFLDARLAFLKSIPGWQYFGKGWQGRVARVRHLAAHPPT
jgi:lysozyme family protein